MPLIDSKHAHQTSIALAALLLVACSPGEEQPGHRPLPNIVLIVTDDQAFSTLPEMPFVERTLVREGTRFENFILSDPICCPSRVTILLGQYRHNHHRETGWPGCASLFFADDQHERSIGLLLQRAGYRTGMVGKYLNSYGTYYSGPRRLAARDLMVGWDDYHTLTGSTKYFDFDLDDNGTINRRSTDHQSDVLAELAIRFIDDSAAAARPFFLYLAPQAPHPPVRPAKRHRGKFADATAPRVPSFNAADLSSQPSLAATKPLSASEVAKIDRAYRRTLQTMLSVDELVRDVIAALARNGALENTYVFYTTDNGFHFGEHRIQSAKGTPFEESIRFPLLVRGPGVPHGVSLPHLVSNTDLHPTLLDLIGEEPDEHVDGRSLVPLLRADGATVPFRSALVIESDHEARNSGIPRFHGIRTRRYKLVEYATGATELYDLALDPHETQSVLDAASPALVAELRDRLGALAHCVGAGCRRIEDLPVASERD